MRAKYGSPEQIPPAEIARVEQRLLKNFREKTIPEVREMRARQIPEEFAKEKQAAKERMRRHSPKQVQRVLKDTQKELRLAEAKLGSRTLGSPAAETQYVNRVAKLKKEVTILEDILEEKKLNEPSPQRTPEQIRRSLRQTRQDLESARAKGKSGVFKARSAITRNANTIARLEEQIAEEEAELREAEQKQGRSTSSLENLRKRLRETEEELRAAEAASGVSQAPSAVSANKNKIARLRDLVEELEEEIEIAESSAAGNSQGNAEGESGEAGGSGTHPSAMTTNNFKSPSQPGPFGQGTNGLVLDTVGKLGTGIGAIFGGLEAGRRLLRGGGFGVPDNILNI